jgi:hypothetical protein
MALAKTAIGELSRISSTYLIPIHKWSISLTPVLRKNFFPLKIKQIPPVKTRATIGRVP